MKVYSFRQNSKDEVYSLINTISSKKYRYCTGHYGKIKLWDFNYGVTSIHFEKNNKYELLYAQKNELVFVLSNNKRVDILSLLEAKVVIKIDYFEHTLNSSVLINDFDDIVSSIHGPYLNYLEIDYTIGLEPECILHKPLIDSKKEENYMSFLLYLKMSNYLVTLNEKGSLFLFKQKSKVNKPLKINNSYWDLLNIMQNSKSSNLNQNSSSYICSLVELSDCRLGEEMIDYTLRIVKLPTLEYIKTIRLSSGSKLISLGENLGEDILVNMNNKTMTFNFIFPFYDSQYNIKSVKTVNIPDNIFKKEGYQKICKGKDTVLIYTKYNIYQVIILN